MFDVAIELYNRYVGTGMMIALCLAAIIYLLFTEKDKTVKAVLVYMPFTFLGIYFCPGLGSLLAKFVGQQAYYRFIWMIPIVIIVGFAIVKLMSLYKGAKRVIIGIICAVIIMLCGEFIYANSDYKKATNIYHIPQPVVDICDEIVVPGREVIAAFPKDLLLYVKQYTINVFMPYGRGAYTDDEHDKLYEIMCADKFYFNAFNEECSKNGWLCHYIIVEADKEIVGDPAADGFDYYKEIDGYAIYRNRNKNYDLVIEEYID